MQTELKCITDSELKNWHQQGKMPDDVVIIDIREPSEHRREHIVNSRNIPADKLAETDFTNEKDKTAIFYCQRGFRTNSSKKAILATGFKEIYCMPEGIQQWKKCDLPTICDKSAPIEIMRQVQIIAGSLVVLGVLLSLLISPYFIALSAFVGLGLMVAGISGNCYMAMALAKMPWNKN